MDTRNKILKPGASLPADVARPVVVVSGYFDVLRAEHLRELDTIRDRTAAKTLVAAVLPRTGEFLSQTARAELAAALRVIDYVLIADPEDLGSFLASVRPLELIRLEEADKRRIRQLIEHVHSRQP